MLGVLIAFGRQKEVLLWFSLYLSCSFIAGFLVLSSEAYDLYHPNHIFLTVKRSNSWGSSTCLLQTWKMPRLLEIFWDFSCQALSSFCLNMHERSFAASRIQAASRRQSARFICRPSCSPSPHLPLSNSPLPSPMPGFEAQRHQHFSGKWLWKNERRIAKNLWGFSLISFSESSTIQLKFSKRVQLSELI